jgi:hypothetical protein
MLFTGLSFKGVTHEAAATRVVLPTSTYYWSLSQGVHLEVSCGPLKDEDRLLDG